MEIEDLLSRDLRQFFRSIPIKARTSEVPKRPEIESTVELLLNDRPGASVSKETRTFGGRNYNTNNNAIP